MTYSSAQVRKLPYEQKPNQENDTCWYEEADQSTDKCRDDLRYKRFAVFHSPCTLRDAIVVGKLLIEDWRSKSPDHQCGNQAE